MKELEFHPYANIFPLIEGEAFAALVEDIAQNGMREPIVLFEGKILDGRNRYRAALQAGVIAANGKAVSLDHHRPTIRQFPISGIEGEPLAWVISANLHRRHLDDGQRAIVAAKLATMGHGGKRVARAKPEEQAADRPVDASAPATPAEPAGMTQAAAAQALNVSERNVRRAKAVVEHGAPELVAAVEKGAIAVTLAEELARLPKDEQAKVAKEMDVGVLYSAVKPMIDRQKKMLVEQKKAKRAAKEQALGARQRALPSKKYGVIYSDCEYDHETWSEAGKDRAPANHYPVSSIAALKARPVQDIAASDCVLFHWSTMPHLAAAIEVMQAWGFAYKSHLIWKKVYPGAQTGTGYWSRAVHEILLIGTRGNPPCPAPGTQSLSVIEAPVGEHSEKPEVFAELIETYFPSLPKIELNARKARPGWDVWGNEAPEAEAEPAAKPAKGKAKKGSAHDYVVEQARRDERIKRRLEVLPDDLDALISAYREAIDSYDFAMNGDDVEQAKALRETMDAILLKANGGNNFGVEVNERPNAVRAAGVAPLGTPPRHGETGHWIVEHREVRAIVELGKHGAALYALDFNRPFPSETGYHCLMDRRAPGETIEAFGRRMIEAAIAYKDPVSGRPRALRHPQSAYRLQLDDDGRLVRRQRGSPVDRAAPPLGLDAGLLDGLDTIRERWREEDRAKYSGQKLQGKRTFPVSLHPNDKIVAVNGQMLTPVADFPTTGAYAYTASKRTDDGWADEWCFVEAAENLDREPVPAAKPDEPTPADIMGEIPAFLRRSREPERCDQTADMIGEGA